MEAQETDDEIKQRIGALFDFAITEDRREFRMAAYRIISSEEANTIKELTEESVENYTDTERLRGQIPVTRADFLLVPDAIASPDVLEYADKTKMGRHVLVYENNDWRRGSFCEARDTNRTKTACISDFIQKKAACIKQTAFR